MFYDVYHEKLSLNYSFKLILVSIKKLVYLLINIKLPIIVNI